MKKIYKTLLIIAISMLYIEPLGDNMWAKSIDKKSIESAYSEVYIYNNAPNIQLYISIKKYCKVYNVPEIYAFKIAHIESGWNGPLHYNYTANDKISSANAYGAMQILLSTAKDVWKDTSITNKQLLNDIDFNVHTSIKYMRQLYDNQCHNKWIQVFAYYNTGHTGINQYALDVLTN